MVASITNINITGTETGINNILKNQDLYAKKLLTGERITYAYEDPAGLAIGTKLKGNVSALRESLKGANQASAVLNIAYGAAKSVQSLVQRLNDLAIMAGNGTNSDAERAKINSEAQQVKEQIGTVIDSATFNGINLLNGDISNKSNGINVPVGLGQQLEINLPSFTAGALGVDSVDLATAESVKNAMTQPEAAPGTYQFEIPAGTKITADMLKGATASADIDGADLNTKLGAGTYTDIAKGADLTGMAQLIGKTVQSGKFIEITVDSSSQPLDLTPYIGLTSGADIKDAGGNILVKKDGFVGVNAAPIPGAISAILEGTATIGAYQSRVNKAIDNLATSVENMTAAEEQYLSADFTEVTKQIAQNNAKLTAAIKAQAVQIGVPQQLSQVLSAV